MFSMFKSMLPNFFKHRRTGHRRTSFPQCCRTDLLFLFELLVGLRIDLDDTCLYDGLLDAEETTLPDGDLYLDFVFHARGSK